MSNILEGSVHSLQRQIDQRISEEEMLRVLKGYAMSHETVDLKREIMSQD